jgi:hypothetical protein
MEAEETFQRARDEAVLREREDEQVVFQLSMRDEFLQIRTECVGKVSLGGDAMRLRVRLRVRLFVRGVMACEGTGAHLHAFAAVGGGV